MQETWIANAIVSSQGNCLKMKFANCFFFGYGLFWAFTWNGRDSTYKSRIMNPNHKLPWYRGFFFCSLLLCVLFNRMKNCAEHLTFCWIVVVMFEFWILYFSEIFKNETKPVNHFFTRKKEIVNIYYNERIMGITVMFSESDAFWELSFRSALWSRVFERFDGRPFMHDALASKGIYIYQITC